MAWSDRSQLSGSEAVILCGVVLPVELVVIVFEALKDIICRVWFANSAFRAKLELRWRFG
jgi:hypothetical protein